MTYLKPTIGRLVIYRSRTGNYAMPAIVTMTTDSAWQPGIDAGDVPPLTSDRHVHLHVLTPGAQAAYQEHDVPFDAGPSAGAEQLPGSWAWPQRS